MGFRNDTRDALVGQYDLTSELAGFSFTRVVLEARLQVSEMKLDGPRKVRTREIQIPAKQVGVGQSIPSHARRDRGEIREEYAATSAICLTLPRPHQIRSHLPSRNQNISLAQRDSPCARSLLDRSDSRTRHQMASQTLLPAPVAGSAVARFVR